MGRRRKKPESEKVEINMTSMIDVVFLLLIFFMVSMKFKTTEGSIMAHLPKDTGSAAGDAKEDRDTIKIHLQWESGASGGPVQSPDYEEMKALIDDMYAVSSMGEAERTERKVIINARPQVPYKYVVRTINACLDLGLTNVRFVHAGEFDTQQAGEGSKRAMWWEDGFVQAYVGDAINPRAVQNTTYAIDQHGAGGGGH